MKFDYDLQAQHAQLDLAAQREIARLNQTNEVWSDYLQELHDRGYALVQEQMRRDERRAFWGDVVLISLGFLTWWALSWLL